MCCIVLIHEALSTDVHNPEDHGRSSQEVECPFRLRYCTPTEGQPMQGLPIEFRCDASRTLIIAHTFGSSETHPRMNGHHMLHGVCG